MLYLRVYRAVYDDDDMINPPRQASQFDCIGCQKQVQRHGMMENDVLFRGNKMKWWAIAGRGRSESCGKEEGIDYEAKSVMPNIYGQLSNRKRKSQTEIKRQTWPSYLNKFRWKISVRIVIGRMLRSCS